MSDAKPEKKVKIVKDKAPKEKPAAPKNPRKRKVPPTPEEVRKILTDNIAQFEKVANELEAEMLKVKPLGVPRTVEVVEATIKDIREDLQDTKEDLEAMKQLPTVPEVKTT